MNSKLISLGHLAGQLGGFVGQSESVKKAVKNAIIAVFNNNPHLKNDLNNLYSSLVTNLSESDNSAVQADDNKKISELKRKVSEEIQRLNDQLESLNKPKNGLPPSPSPSADSDKLQSKLDALEKVEELCGFHENSNNPQNNPKNLLENLCDGLQTFLGYSSASKGYDGTGIVYSDLDRLCDAVMGFLSGVLGAVKNENEVTTYDNYITPDDKKLTKVIEKVTKNIGTGRAGLAASVAEVKEWLEGYEREVNEKTENLITTINHIQNEIVSAMQKCNGDFGVVDDASQAFLSFAKDKVETINNDGEIIKCVDRDLQTKLRPNIDSVAQAIESFEQKLKNDDLQKIHKLSAEKFDVLNVLADKKQTHKQQIYTVVEQFKKYAKGEIEHLKKNLDAVYDVLVKWIQQAEDAVQLALIKVGEIVKKLNGIGDTGAPGDKNAVENAAKELYERAMQLYHSACEVTSKVDDLVATAKMKVDELNTAIGYDLWNLKATIKSDISSYIEKAKKNFEMLKQKTVKGDADQNETSVEKRWNHLKQEIKRLVDGIYTKDKSGDLYKLEKRIKEYVKKFEAKKFGDIIQQWVREILNTEPVKGCVEKYFSNPFNKISGKFNATYINPVTFVLEPGTMDRIAVEIKEQLRMGIIEDAENKMADMEDERIGNIVHRVYSCINEFSKKLDAKIDAGENPYGNGNKFVEAVATAIEKVVATEGENSTSKGHLESAVAAILTGLKSAAKQSAKEGDSIAAASHSDNLGAEVEAVIEAVRQINAGINAGNPGFQIDVALQGVHRDIKTLDSTLTTAELHAKIEKQLPKDSGHMGLGSPIELTNLKQYEVRNKNANGVTTKKGAKPQLEDAINDIKLSVTKYIESLHDGPLNFALDDLTGNLKAYCNEVRKLADKDAADPSLNKQDETLKDGLKQMLIDLQSRIGVRDEEGLKLIRDNMKTLKDDTLNQLKTFVEEALESAKSEACKVIEFVHNDYQYNIKLASHQIHCEAILLYRKRRETELLYLSKIVDEARTKVQETIEREKTKGIKGLIRTLNGLPAHTPLNSGHVTTLLTDIKIGLPIRNPNTKPINVYFKNTSRAVDRYFDLIYRFINNEVKTPAPERGLFPSENDESKRLDNIKKRLDDVLKHIENDNKYLFDHTFAKLLSHLSSSLTALHPSHFANPRHPELLDAVKKGLERFVKEMERVYVNGYDSRVFIEDLVKKVENNNVKAEKRKIPDDDSSPKYMLTQYGEKCAKVCVTVLKNLYEYLRHLKVLCEGNGFSKEINAITQLGLFLQAAGYKVSTERNGQDGELRNSSDMQGQHIIGRLAPGIANAKNIQHLNTCSSREESKDNKFNVMGILKCILTHVDEYFTVRHRFNSSFKKNPCSVYEMLAWLTGLHYNSAYQDMLRDGVVELLYDPKKQKTEVEDDFEFTAVDTSSLYLQAYPYNVSYNDISTAIDDLCSHAYDLLIAIAGTGDAYTRYGCEYYDNSLGLYYPASGEDCFDMLLDVLRRVFPVFRFLYVRCSVPAKYYGWSDCQYGKEVKHSNWQCKDHSKSKSTCQATCQPNDQPNCQPTSPLMSYLNDCLPGHLPHELSDIGCKAKCVTCPRGTKGMPCLTPCGFRTFSGSTKLGKHICDIVSKFFGNGQPSVLFCMVAKAPSTLPEHFGFVLSLVKRWNNTETYPSKRAVESSIKNLSIELYKSPTDLTSALEKAYGSNQTSHVHSTRDSTSAELSSLCMETPCSGGNHCAPYLSSLHSDAYLYLSEKNADSYLSWAIYLPWNFWNLLNNLYNAFCSINCQDWGCRGCLRGDKCKKGQHGVVDDDKPDATCQCPSIVQCKGVAPTLYQYGFVFGEASTLNDKQSPKRCSDFCSQLKNVLTSEYFKKLFDECDNFLWIIRQPFTYLVLALWLLSLLYLLHIMVIRLDLLHIKSHLHSPSSHRIAAQSLLAAARVNKLNRVFYLQP